MEITIKNIPNEETKQAILSRATRLIERAIDREARELNETQKAEVATKISAFRKANNLEVREIIEEPDERESL